MKTKALTTLLLLGLVMNFSGFGVFTETLAYYNDTENSPENILSAGSLDFALAPASHEKSIGVAEEVSVSSVLANSGTLDWQYMLEAEKISGDDDFCSVLELEAKLNGVEKYDGPLLSFDIPFLAALGAWKFNIELPIDAVGVAHGDTCEVDFLYKGWQAEISLYEDSGFIDEERINITLTARMIALNEFLPRPNGEAYGFDFGNDSSDMPQGEWVELYNNSDSSFDLAGWYIRDATNGPGNKTDITALNTAPATTVIGGKSWLVVYMNKAILNNTGDTVRLFDDSDTLIDSHKYKDNDFCEIEPSPGDENSTDASGECGGVPPNKSYARIPDGIGDWVDPIPTPGRLNRLDEVEKVIVAQDTGSPEEVIAPVSEEEIIVTLEEAVVMEETLPTEEPVDTTKPVIEPEVVKALAPDPEKIVAEEPPPEKTPPAEPEPVSEPVTVSEETNI